MARSKRQPTVAEQLAMDRLMAAGKSQDVDWDATNGVDWPALLAALVAADGAIMLRSSDQGRAIAVGVFISGPGVWQTCRDLTEFTEYLTRATATFEELAGKKLAPVPTAKGKRATKAL